MAIIASLPYPLLWAASLAASTDGSKGSLCSVDARQEGSNIRIAAVDGHRCFRCYFPSSELFFISKDYGAEKSACIRLSPKAFSKAPSRKTLVAEIDDGEKVVFKDKLNLPQGASMWTPDPWALLETPFPNIDQIWPSKASLSCSPGAFTAMDASYVADFAKIAAKIGGHMRLHSADSPHTPIVWESLFCKSWLPDSDTLGQEEIWMQYLLMPLMVRRD